jgi:hypothetical protein
MVKSIHQQVEQANAVREAAIDERRARVAGSIECDKVVPVARESIVTPKLTSPRRRRFWWTLDSTVVEAGAKVLLVRAAINGANRRGDP